jgi:protein-L-isoaspartate O-methyltransferase
LTESRNDPKPGEVYPAAGAGSRRIGRRCRVLEIGAGHGMFTDYLVGLGAEVWVTEMSKASADLLRSRFAGHDGVHVMYDEDGSGAAHGPHVGVPGNRRARRRHDR